MKECEAFCVVDNRGLGHPKDIATTAYQAKCNYVWSLVGLSPNVDPLKWWRENAKKHHVRVVKVTISTTERFKAERWDGWYNIPEEECCMVDNGWLNVKRCDARAKHDWADRRVCTSHKKMLEAGRELKWIY